MKPRILIIEDNEQNLYLLTFIVEKHGCEAQAARRRGWKWLIGQNPT